MAHRSTHDPETSARLANVLSLAHQGTPERAWKFALCRCDRDTGRLEVVKRCLARTRDEAVAFFGCVSPEMFVASIASLAVTGVMPVGSGFRVETESDEETEAVPVPARESRGRRA